MANLSQQKRERMIEFLKQLKALHTDDNSLIALNEIENEILSKKYGLVWEQHDEQVDIMMRENVPVFSEVAEREIIEDHCNDKYNFLLEGDNLHSLKLLEKTHRGGIDVIYIDPPYNTGSKDFIYNDAIVDSNDGFKHSKWLSFISERLELAKNLLKPTGMIMISINEIELYSLKLLCDSIFGDDNFLANMIWQSTPGSNTGLDIKTVTEYVLCYAKDKSKVLTASRDNIDTSKYNLKDEYAERRGGYVLNKLDRRMTGQHYSDALNYQIEMPDGTMLFPGSNDSKQPNWNWRWSSTKVKWGIENGFIVFKQTKGVWAVYFKQYQFVDNNDNIIERTLPYQNLIKDIEGANSARGTQEVMNMFGSKAFDYPKPLNLIKYLLQMHNSPNGIVLDFFAGSGTTAQAVLELNKEKGQNRSFILCTNNDNAICENVTYQRIKTVITGYNINGDEYGDGIGSNLKYYKTDFIAKTSSDANYSVSDELLKHIKEMIQLENGIKVDDENYIIILTDEDADALEKKPEIVEKCKGIYISNDVFLTSSQEQLFSGIVIKQIPDYYFEEELREVHEIW